MPRIALTDLSIRALKFTGERRDYWDTKTPSFGVRIGKNRKTFVAKVDNQRITIGEYGSRPNGRRQSLPERTQDVNKWNRNNNLI